LKFQFLPVKKKRCWLILKQTIKDENGHNEFL
jgi:hypothetical protein